MPPVLRRATSANSSRPKLPSAASGSLRTSRPPLSSLPLRRLRGLLAKRSSSQAACADEREGGQCQDEDLSNERDSSPRSSPRGGSGRDGAHGHEGARDEVARACGVHAVELLAGGGVLEDAVGVGPEAVLLEGVLE